MWLGEVPFPTEVGIDEVEVDFHHVRVAVAVWESKVIVVQTISRDLTTNVLNLMPEVGNDEACIFAATIEATIDGSNHFDLPRAIVEWFRRPIETPLPLFRFSIVKEGIELIPTTYTGVREPTHGNQITIGSLHNTSFTQPFLSWCVGFGFQATNL
ncbi:MAG: Uncharacterised protein [Marine Group II euryarchaeote MED-G33]|nr:MAG: Uncharacterised protein [Marine Group II euryarchaeote MED-G33]